MTTNNKYHKYFTFTIKHPLQPPTQATYRIQPPTTHRVVVGHVLLHPHTHC